MRRIVGAIGALGFAFVLLVPTALAAGPASAGRTGGPTADNAGIAAVLNLSWEQVQDLRQQGQSLAEIAAAQQVDPQRLVDALVARWTERIDVRVQNGALTAAQATELKSRLAARAQAYVDQTVPGGMAGAAVGAGPRGAGAGMRSGVGPGPRGTGTGTGTCDGTGPHGPGRP